MTTGLPTRVPGAGVSMVICCGTGVAVRNVGAAVGGASVAGGGATVGFWAEAVGAAIDGMGSAGVGAGVAGGKLQVTSSSTRIRMTGQALADLMCGRLIFIRSS